MVMGLHARTSSAYGPTYTCLRKDRAALDVEIDAAVSRLPRGIHQPSERSAASAPSRPALRVGTAAEGATIKEGSFVIVDDALMQIIDGAPRKIEVRGGKGTEGIPAKHARIIRTLIPIRDAIREVLRAQEANEPWGTAQTRLRIAYNSFLRNFGADQSHHHHRDDRSEDRRGARDPAPAQSPALPRRSRRLARRLDRGL